MCTAPSTGVVLESRLKRSNRPLPRIVLFESQCTDNCPHPNIVQSWSVCQPSMPSHFCHRLWVVACAPLTDQTHQTPATCSQGHSNSRARNPSHQHGTTAAAICTTLLNVVLGDEIASVWEADGFGLVPIFDRIEEFLVCWHVCGKDIGVDTSHPPCHRLRS